MEPGALHTLAKGARQLVVQEALDTMGALGSYESQFTPTTYVGMSEPLAGAVISTCVMEAHVTLERLLHEFKECRLAARLDMPL